MTVVLPLILDGQKLTKGADFPKVIASDSKNFLELKLSGVPDNSIAKAYFKQSWDADNSVYDATFYDGSLIVPEYITTLPHNINKYVDYVVSVSVTLIGNGEERGNTNPVEIVLVKSNYAPTTTNTPDLPPSQYESLVGEVISSIIVDDELSSSSTNPVQNKVVDERFKIVVEDYSQLIGDVEKYVKKDISNSVGELKETVDVLENDIQAVENRLLDEIEAYKTIVDDELSLTSTNPVQNQAITREISNIETTTNDHNRRITTLEQNSAGGGGGITVTDDGNGNVAIVALGGIIITDDGNGNVVIA